MMIYFIQDTRNREIKIGVATKPMERMRELQTAHASRLILIGVMEGGREIEQQLHQQFTRIRGEWFHPTPELLAYIRREAVAARQLERSAPALPLPEPERTIIPIDLQTLPYEPWLLWQTTLLAVQGEPHYTHPSSKIARLLSHTFPNQRRQTVYDDVERIVVTIRSMFTEDVDAILANIPPDIQMPKGWR